MSVEKAMDTLRQAMKDDLGYAHSWHCAVAMMCNEAILMADIVPHYLMDEIYAVSNDAASRVMKLFFDAETKVSPCGVPLSGISTEDLRWEFQKK